MQMLARVRQLENNNVLVYLNNIPFKEKSNFYTYDELKEYICEVYNKYLEPKSILDNVKNKMIIKYNFDLYAQILVHNETENANKTKNLFIPYLIKLLTDKGHTYVFKQEKGIKKEYDKDSILINDIINAGDITDEHFNMLINKQRNNDATKDDKILIERHLLKKDWKITEITNEFLIKYYGKTNILNNLRFLTDKKKLEPYIQTDNDDYKIDFDKAEKLEQVEMITDIIDKIGFGKINSNIKLNKETFQNNIKKVLNECQIFSNPNKSQPLFGYDKNKIGKVQTIKQFMGFLNSLLKDWGLEIKLNRVSIKKDKTVNKINFYKLHYIDNINDFV